MSLVPMGGNKPSFNAEIFAKDENVGIAYGMGLTAEKVAQQWKVSREMQDAFALDPTCAPSRRKRLVSSATKSRPSKSWSVRPTSPPAKWWKKRRTVSLDEGPRPDTSPEGLAKLKPCLPHAAASRRATARRPAMARARPSCQRKGGEAVWPDALARFVSYAARGVPPEIMGIGPIEAIPRRCGMRA